MKQETLTVMSESPVFKTWGEVKRVVRYVRKVAKETERFAENLTETPVESSVAPPERVPNLDRIRDSLHYLQDFPTMIETIAHIRTIVSIGGMSEVHDILMEIESQIEKKLDAMFGMDGY